MKKNILVLLTLVVVFYSCSKKDATQNTTLKTTYTIKTDSTLVKPSVLVSLTASEVITRDTFTVLLGGNPIVLLKTDNYHFSFFVPTLEPGNYTFDLTNLNSDSHPTLTINNYTHISNPDAVIESGIKTYNGLVDSLLINCFKGSVTNNDATFMHQLMTQLKQNVTKCNNNEKLAIAYQLQNLNLNTNICNPDVIKDSTYILGFTNPIKKITFGTQVFGLATDDDVSKTVTDFANESLIYTAAASLSAGCFTASLLALRVPALQTYAACGLLTSAAGYFICTKKAASKNSQAVSFAAVAMESPLDMDGNGTPNNPIILSENKSVIQKILCKLRGIQEIDKVGLNSTITNCINSSNQLEVDDNTVKIKFDDIKAKFNSWFNVITTNYQSYVSPIKATLRAKLARIKPKFITITNVSNPNITITATDDGNNGISVTADNPSGTITTNTKFTYQINYTQPAFNKTVKVIEQAEFKPMPTLKIGDTAFGGIIFYLDGTGQHGLVCATTDQGTIEPWDATTYPADPITYPAGNPYTTPTGATATAIGTGAANTTKIIAVLGSNGVAASLCRNYRGGGYTDWFLPSIDELKEMYYAGRLTSIRNSKYADYYWSSTECVGNMSITGANDLDVSSGGGIFCGGKANAALYVRAARAF